VKQNTQSKNTSTNQGESSSLTSKKKAMDEENDPQDSLRPLKVYEEEEEVKGEQIQVVNKKDKKKRKKKVKAEVNEVVEIEMQDLREE